MEQSNGGLGREDAEAVVGTLRAVKDEELTVGIPGVSIALGIDIRELREPDEPSHTCSFGRKSTRL